MSLVLLAPQLIPLHYLLLIPNFQPLYYITGWKNFLAGTA